MYQAIKIMNDFTLLKEDWDVKYGLLFYKLFCHHFTSAI